MPPITARRIWPCGESSMSSVAESQATPACSASERRTLMGLFPAQSIERMNKDHVELATAHRLAHQGELWRARRAPRRYARRERPGPPTSHAPRHSVRQPSLLRREGGVVLLSRAADAAIDRTAKGMGRGLLGGADRMGHSRCGLLTRSDGSRGGATHTAPPIIQWHAYQISPALRCLFLVLDPR